MTGNVLPVTGYLGRLSVMPGEVLRAHISKRRAGPIRARLVRVISGDPNPAGPGMKFEDFSHRFDKVMDGKYYPIRLGSYYGWRHARFVSSHTIDMDRTGLAVICL